jgi:hypothetical protein
MPLPPAKVQSLLTRLLAGAVLLSGKPLLAGQPIKGIISRSISYPYSPNPDPDFLVNPDPDLDPDL